MLASVMPGLNICFACIRLDLKKDGKAKVAFWVKSRHSLHYKSDFQKKFKV